MSDTPPDEARITLLESQVADLTRAVGALRAHAMMTRAALLKAEATLTGIASLLANATPATATGAES
jgi:hypothetical protein